MLSLELYNLLPYFIFICACHLRNVFMSLHRSADNKDYAPFPDRLLGSPRLNKHTAQSPLLTEEPSGFFTQYSETIKALEYSAT